MSLETPSTADSHHKASNMNQKHIVMLLNKNYIPSFGLYPRIKNMAQTLIKRGCRVTMICWDRSFDHPEEEWDDGVFVIRIRVRSGESLGPKQIVKLTLFMAKAVRVMKTLKPDAVHCHNIDALPAAIYYGKRHRVPIVFDAHEPDYYANWTGLNALFLPMIRTADLRMSKTVDLVFVVNEYQVEKYKKQGQINVLLAGNLPHRDIILNSVDEDKFLKEECTFGRLGTFYEDCGLEQIVEAFKLIRQEHENAKLFLAGTVLERYQKQFAQLTSELNQGIEIAGPYAAGDIVQLSKKIDVALLPYVRTNWFKNITPTKFYDNLASGIPMLMTDIGGLGKVIRQNNLGIVIDENDVPGIVNAMKNLLINRPLRKEMATNCLRCAKETYNWEAIDPLIADKYSSLFKNN